MTRMIGAVTVGQSPRDDVVPEIVSELRGDMRVLQCGALDRFTADELQPQAPGCWDTTLVTRMRDGEEVRVKRSFVVPLLADCVRSLESRVDLIALLCTDPFRELTSSKPLLSPGRLFPEMVAELRVDRLGVLVPAEAQVDAQCEKWSDLVPEVFIQAASPYGDEQRVGAAAESLSHANVDLVVMNCIGYTKAMKRAVQSMVRCPVLLASETVARAAGEVLGG
ncbi:MAG: AroM family protein [Gemmatimonadota bacterium]|nr:MAG: AroM family protein [Gemmatimonadota bacterium]